MRTWRSSVCCRNACPLCCSFQRLSVEMSAVAQVSVSCPLRQQNEFTMVIKRGDRMHSIQCPTIFSLDAPTNHRDLCNYMTALDLPSLRKCCGYSCILASCGCWWQDA